MQSAYENEVDSSFRTNLKTRRSHKKITSDKVQMFKTGGCIPNLLFTSLDELLAAMSALIETLPFRSDCDYECETAVSSGIQGGESIVVQVDENIFSPDVINPLIDEAHFWLNGYVNKQNCRIWSKANPQVYVETPLHLEKLTVWCALWAGGIIGPYFFKNDEGHNVTVNGDRYRAMITNFFIP
ncbi:uncharacterized protein TNCV_1931811 [Trichonephila clavipes]|nr:uncharacterized protein TNCV_1931811 [Trichonephila clavipes]